MNDADARLVAKICVEQFAGAIGRAVVDDDDVQVGKIGSEDGRDRLRDDGFFVVRGHEDSDARRRNRHDNVIGS